MILRAFILGVLLTALPQDKRISDADKKTAQQKVDAGTALLNKKDVDGGTKLLEEAVKLDPGHAKAHEALTRAYFSAGNRLGAFDHVMRLGDLAPLSSEMRKILNAVQTPTLAGFRWMLRHQSPDGRWSGDGFGNACKGGACDGKGEAGADLRTTCMVLMVLTGASYAPMSKDTYDQKVVGTSMKNALTWLMKLQNPDGGIGDPASARSLEDHALAALTLVEIYDYTALKGLHEPAQKAVDYLLAQRTAGSGWGPKPKAEPDPTATGWAIFALEDARRSGLKVGVENFAAERAAISATSLFGPAIVGWSGDEGARKGLAAQMQKLSGEGVAEDPKQRDSLQIYLATLLLQHGDATQWKKWGDSVKATLLKTQRSDNAGDSCVAGSWDPSGTAETVRGRVQTTAFNLLTVEAVYDYANVFGKANSRK